MRITVRGVSQPVTTEPNQGLPKKSAGISARRTLSPLLNCLKPVSRVQPAVSASNSGRGRPVAQLKASDIRLPGISASQRLETAVPKASIASAVREKGGVHQRFAWDGARETPMPDRPETVAPSTHEAAQGGWKKTVLSPQNGPLPTLKRGARRVISALVCGAPQVPSVRATKLTQVPDPESARNAAAQTAREAACPEHPLYLELSAAMCWDAVKHCAITTGLLKPDINAQHELVSQADGLIHGREAMAVLPEGHAVGFFDGDRLVHVMMSIGAGHAAGNKNDCIGMGHPAGWETLDLNRLKWNQDGSITAPGLLRAERTLMLRSRLLGGATA